MFLGNAVGLGGEVTACFTKVVNSSTLAVVKGVIMTRSGFEERTKATANLQEIVKWLPSDLFRTCLARVRPPALAPLTGDISTFRIVPPGVVSQQFPRALWRIWMTFWDLWGMTELPENWRCSIIILA